MLKGFLRHRTADTWKGIGLDQSPEQEFQRYLARLAEEVIHVDSKFELYFHLLNRRTDSLEALNVSPAFFQLTLDALFNDTIVCVARLYEDRKSQRNLQRFLDFVEEHVAIFSNEAQQSRGYKPDPSWSPKGVVDRQTVMSHRAQIKSKHDILSHLFIRRNKIHAHLDDKYFYERITLKEEAPLSFGNLRDLIKLAGDILNDYSVAFNGVGQVFTAVNRFDVNNLLKILQGHLTNNVAGPPDGCT